MSPMPTGDRGRQGLVVAPSQATRARWSRVERCSNNGWLTWPKRSPTNRDRHAPLDGADTGSGPRSSNCGKKERTACTIGSATKFSSAAGGSNGYLPDKLEDRGLLGGGAPVQVEPLSVQEVLVGNQDFSVRPMAVDEVDAVMAVVSAANTDQVARGVIPQPPPRTAAQTAANRRAHVRFVERDGPGAWVAVRDGSVVGMAEAIRRDRFWGLSMLFVRPEDQSRGVGRALLEASLGYATGGDVRMIQSSPDPRAMRRYAQVGLAMHPTAEISGSPDRQSIPVGLPGREGDADDLELVASVEAALSRSRTEDVAFGLEVGNRLDVVETHGRRGWVLWQSGHLLMLGATDEETAATLLWRYLGQCDDNAVVFGLTAAQNWAFDVAHRARLSLRVDGAMFVAGMAVPGPWIPSGWFF
jgi:GNAT superfamily N-acetyltransferase